MDLGQNTGKFKNSHKCTIFHLYGLIFLWSKAIGTLYTWTQCALWIWYISLKFSVGKDCRRSPCYSSQALMRLAARVLNDMHLFCRKPTIFKTETISASQILDQFWSTKPKQKTQSLWRFRLEERRRSIRKAGN